MEEVAKMLEEATRIIVEWSIVIAVRFDVARREVVPLTKRRGSKSGKP